ncbi:hypothetical protein BDZ94DRAFT_1261483 [Collybia nuda]|uniref:Uncharacterized protein n=1 Tax=Collybia nuda TaxID=64659 RepID=A0A9P6CIV3_9AGAR|nr:hypothetical protein BDZ94DRAFT_1261483 [Collybia nuda]
MPGVSNLHHGNNVSLRPGCAPPFLLNIQYFAPRSPLFLLLIWLLLRLSTTSINCTFGNSPQTRRIAGTPRTSSTTNMETHF